MRVVTLVAWALAGWSLTYWSLQFAGAPPRAAAGPTPPAQTAPVGEPAQIARLFGPAIEKPAEIPAAPVAVDPSTRFALLGVVANRASAGVALLSVEGKPARPYRVGSTIDEAYTLKSVTARSATLATGPTGATFTVNLAAMPGTSASPAGAAVRPGIPVAPANPASAVFPPRIGPGIALPMGPRSS